MCDQETLANRCSEVVELSERAIAWVMDPGNAERVGTSVRSDIKTLRRVGRRARKLYRAARTRMSISVFGPSQAGKSFLVSVLARPKDGELFSAYNDPNGILEYLKEVNPEGQGESTGLVTRFTMAREETPAGFPIKLTLLSEADIVRTLLNSFFNDGDGSETPPDASDISAHFAQFSKKVSAPVPGLTADDVLEIGEYVDGGFGRSAYAAALRGFWEEAAKLAPKLSRADREAFFAIIWGNHVHLGQLYRKLADGLASVDNAEVVYAKLDALVPRENSIIDVKTLKGLSGEDVGPDLQLTTDTGRECTMSRGLICALAAELDFPMQTQPSPVLGRADLLDFPGARNRFDAPLSVTLSSGDVEDNLRELLLRGKVAYLFDRYVENQEITSMLLCIPGSNMETVSLPGLVENWIALTQGSTPAARTEVDTVLFFVMTKFDEMLVDSGAAGGDATRFERRMEASLLEKFTKGKDKWVEEWSRGKPFDNCFWLRNPKYPADSVITYEAGRETGHRDDRKNRLAELKAGYLKSSHVQRHFSDPSAAWDAALALNDGGVTYLTEALTRVAKPDSKIRQIAAQLAKLCDDAAGQISVYHVSDDIEARIEEKRVLASRVIDGVANCSERLRFGSFLAALALDKDALEARIARVPTDVRIRSSSGAALNAPKAEARTMGLNRPSRASAAKPAADPEVTAETENTVGGPKVRSLTMESYQAETAIELWLDAMKRFRDDPRAVEVYGFEQTALGDLVAELGHAAQRVRLTERIGAALVQTNFGLGAAEQAPSAAIICAEQINDFVATLDAANADDRPDIEDPTGLMRPVFTPRPGNDTADNLPAENFDSSICHASDWVYMLEAMFIANGKDAGSGTVDIEQDLALGAILAGFRPKARADG